jgi:hypothetical protein
MEKMLLSNKERESIYSMIDIANRICDPNNPVNKSEKRQKRLTKLKSFDQGLEFAELINDATSTASMFETELLPWRKLAKEKKAEERALKRKKRRAPATRTSKESKDSKMSAEKTYRKKSSRKRTKSKTTKGSRSSDVRK